MVALAAGPLLGGALVAQAPVQVAAKPTPDTLAAAPDSAIRDSVEVRAVARRHAGAIRNCYQENGLKADPALRGLVRVELVVLPTGVVEAATATATDVSGTGMPAVTTCVSTVVRAWRFSEDAPRTERVVLEFDLLPPSP
jgi:hypothetical protein